MDQADLIPNEQVHVWDIDNGARMVTYAIVGERGSGEIRINGAAARLVREGDKVIIASYAVYDEADLEHYSPVVVHVDAGNGTPQGRFAARGAAQRRAARRRDPRQPRRH